MRDPPTPDQIRATRKRIGWSQDRVARELEVTGHTVWRWEQGDPMPYTAWYTLLGRVSEEEARQAEAKRAKERGGK